MKPVKALLASILLLAMSIVVSCTQPSAMKEPGVGNVRLTTTEEKGLDVLDAGGIDHYEYEAHPRFALEEGFRLYGETDWKELGADTGSSEIIGPFTQGPRTFRCGHVGRDGRGIHIRIIPVGHPRHNAPRSRRRRCAF